jgi:signal transduction histidine kinase
MEDILREQAGAAVELVLNLDPGAGTVMADPGQVWQAVMTLVGNARDAMPGGGQLTIEVANAASGGKDAVMLAVRDTGTGMDEATKARIFEPFFTTKGVGVGTGLGLSAVLGIVQQSGGTILVESEPGRGSTFRVYLPKVGEPIRA